MRRSSPATCRSIAAHKRRIPEMKARENNKKHRNILGPFLEKHRNRLAARYARGKILDLGCGPARILQYLEPDQDYVGVDIKRELVERLQSSVTRENTRFYSADIKDFIQDMDETFDTILMIAFIEHLEDPGSMLESAARLLDENGTLVITTPTPFADRLHGLLATMGLTSKDAVEEHYSLFSRQDMEALLSSIDIKIGRCKRFELGLNQLFICEKDPAASG